MIRADGLPTRGRSGQSTAEHALIVAILVLALVAAGWMLAPRFVPAMQRLGQRAESVYTTGDLAR
ncbi:MAG: hypothetical protein JXB39_03410 [Deltaproteobacteria bacterium]|nr:hypothetical protein [Deltaproteobacteria bacterium]